MQGRHVASSAVNLPWGMTAPRGAARAGPGVLWAHPLTVTPVSAFALLAAMLCINEVRS